jgi:hypothetical protein
MADFTAAIARRGSDGSCDVKKSNTAYANAESVSPFSEAILMARLTESIKF